MDAVFGILGFLGIIVSIIFIIVYIIKHRGLKVWVIVLVISSVLYVLGFVLHSSSSTNEKSPSQLDSQEEITEKENLSDYAVNVEGYEKDVSETLNNKVYSVYYYSPLDDNIKKEITFTVFSITKHENDVTTEDLLIEKHSYPLDWHKTEIGGIPVYIGYGEEIKTDDMIAQKDYQNMVMIFGKGKLKFILETEASSEVYASEDAQPNKEIILDETTKIAKEIIKNIN